ncbi:hypothetical protein G6011_07816 [Alternaria panax]|uniref:Uncharacterized protein n=1 Tax=Alternaria panax TaxID=48097 RepID=A0AAD4F849_9PLEO|nr:hypothetical protein G6011_07816 [Alternaria panax]
MKLFGLALAGLVALVTASPVETTVTAVLKYKNDGIHTYACDSDSNVVSCVPSGTCSFVDYCSIKCFTDREGAGCDGTKTTAAVIEASEKRDVDPEVEPEDKKTYECSNDHTGVLVCQYGFCQTDHYCKKGTKCRDNCSCCRNMDLLERDIDDLDTPKISQPESDVDDVQALPVFESDILASRANNSPRGGPCTPGTYMCTKKSATQDQAWIVVCGWDGKYVYSSGCGDMDCISDGVVAHCWNPGEEWKSYATLASRAEKPPQDGPCAPGTYTCVLNPSTGTAWIVVCGWNQKLQYSSDCGEQKCLAGENGVAHCWNNGPEWNTKSVSVSRRDVPDQVPSNLAGSASCRPGYFACDWRNSTQTSWIITCDQSGNWVWSSDCGRGMECDYANSAAHCVPQKSTLGARDDPLDVPADLAPMQTCRPGGFGCAWSNTIRTEWTIVCDQSGNHWQWSSNCGKDMKCISGGGVAHCVAQNALFEAWQADQGLDLVVRQDPTTCTHPGEVACNDHIVVRCDNGHWTEIKNCGLNVCAIDQNREFHCIPPMAITASAKA